MNKQYYKIKLSKFWYINPWLACIDLQKQTNELSHKYYCLTDKFDDQEERNKRMSNSFNECLKENRELKKENNELQICLGVHGLDNMNNIIEQFSNLQNRNVLLNESCYKEKSINSGLREENFSIKSKIELANAEIERLKHIIKTKLTVEIK